MNRPLTRASPEIVRPSDNDSDEICQSIQGPVRHGNLGNPIEPPTDRSHFERDYEDNFEISSRAEIHRVLSSMCEHGSLITFSFNRGHDFLLTTILAVSADGTTVIFDQGGSAQMNRKVLMTGKIGCQSRLDKVKIRFILAGVVANSYEGRDALLSAVPDSLIRLQRRKYYRLPVPQVNPIAVCIPVVQQDGSITNLRADGVDISGGGIGLSIPPGNPCLGKDAQLSGVTITLPKIGNVSVDMQVRNIHNQAMPNGKIHQRAVCQFNALPEPVMAMIQRYIFHVERERIARVVSGGRVANSER